MLHSYTIASIYAGLNAAKSLANKLGIQVKASDRAFYHGGVEGFLKDFFIRENVVWRGKLEFASDPVKELEASEIFIFSTFKPPLRNENTEAKSVSALEKELFRLQCGKEHIIPVRYVGDNYFGGGPWPLLGLEFARYWIINDKNKEKAVKIIEHVANMVSEDWPAVPEQEIVDKSCLAPDPMNYMEYNGGKPIMDLNWASSAFVAAVATLYKHKK
jgi:GH15 family glucan-1,4-alpha-glucosidase